MWYLIGLIWIAMLAGVVWAYRRKRKKRIAGRAQQFAALLSELRLPPEGGAAVPAIAPVSAAPARKISRKPRLLPKSAALLYFVFKTGLPDHEVFAGLPLSELVEIESALSGYEREQTARKLMHCRLDLVVCNKRLEVVAAVLLSTGAATGAGQAENARFAEECLQIAGVRLVRVDAAAPPRHQQVRELIYGAG